MRWAHVEGADKGRVALYGLSTCLWCNKAKRFLGSLGIAYDYLDVDLLPETEKEAVREEVARLKGRAIYPLVVINGTPIPVFSEEKVRQALNL